MKLKAATKPTLLLTLIFLLNTSTVDAGWLKRFGNWIAKSWQPVHGRYRDGASNKTAPVTTFDRAVFSVQRDKIRARVINKEHDYNKCTKRYFPNCSTL